MSQEEDLQHLTVGLRVFEHTTPGLSVNVFSVILHKAKTRTVFVFRFFSVVLR